MYHPTLEEVKKLHKQGNLVPVYREITADMDTPVSAYLKIARGKYSFLLESVEGGERLARYSFIGTEPSLVIRTGEAIKAMNHPHPHPNPLPSRERELLGGEETEKGSTTITSAFPQKGGGAASELPPHLNPLPRGGEETGKAGDPLSPALSHPSAQMLRRASKGREGKGVDPLSIIEKEFQKFKPVHVEGLPPFHGGMVGYLSYEIARYFEKLPAPERDAQGLPEAVFMLADSLLVFDHISHSIKIVSHAYLDGDIEEAYRKATDKIDALATRLSEPMQAKETASKALTKYETQSNVTKEQYEKMVERAKEYIYNGDIIQVVPSQRLSRKTQANPFTIYRALRSINPSPYMYFLHLGDFHIVGASPELLVRVEDGIVSNHPIAGTRPRDKDIDKDKALAEELKNDEKECAEHLMLVDLARNDVGRISEPGTVKVTQFMDIERYSHVMHLVSHVQGQLKKGFTQFDAMRACFPAGTVSGAPKIRAMEIIAELEPDKRGPYAGAVGYFDFSGNMDTAIAIRTIVLKDGTAYVQAGGGVVADSVPATEYIETLNKAQASLSAIDRAEAE